MPTHTLSDSKGVGAVRWGDVFGGVAAATGVGWAMEVEYASTIARCARDADPKTSEDNMVI